jgi:hypothetical protein
MRIHKLLASLAAFALIAAVTLGAIQAKTLTTTTGREARESSLSPSSRVRVPLNLAILIQDDLVSGVGNELDVTREFIRSLPGGSRVMIGYVTSGTLQVRQQFTTDLERAAQSLRIPASSTAVSPYNPYVEVREALLRFDTEGMNRNALLLISDGLDVSRGFDFTSSVRSLDLDRAIREAKSREVAVYTFYAPAVGLTSWNRRAVSFGQSALNRLADETGGEAFFQGTSFVTFNAYFNKLGQTINKQHATE